MQSVQVSHVRPPHEWDEWENQSHIWMLGRKAAQVEFLRMLDAASTGVQDPWLPPAVPHRFGRLRTSRQVKPHR